MNARWHVFYGLLIVVLLLGLVGMGRQAGATAKPAKAELTAEEVFERLLANPRALQVVDMRGKKDYEEGRVPGAIRLALETVEKIDRYKETIFVSDDGDRKAFREKREMVLVPRNLRGGMVAWALARLPQDTGPYDPLKAGLIRPG